MISPEFKSSIVVSAKLRYKGVPYNKNPKSGEHFQNPKDHPDYYKNFRIEEIHPRQYDWANGIFVRISCVERKHATPCGGWRYIRPDEWEIVKEWD